VTAAVDIRGLTKRFGDLDVLAGVTLKVEASESLAILGPSGCGKTTLLRILLGLEHADGGEVRRAPDRTGYLPQGSVLLPWKRVWENLELPMQIRGIGRQERGARIQSHLEPFGLLGFERAFPHELSGGMQQRAALLRAILAGASTLLLDEPFGALDTVTRHRLQNWLYDVSGRLERPLIFVTHDLDEALVLAERIAVLSERPARLIGQLKPRLEASERTQRMSASFLRARQDLIRLIDPEADDV
jgi:ABC-type nitrate/sulfonate/bicarbonate transport system ATPase subunit